MYIFQCKLCGGRILFEKEDTVGECESCSVKQTLPRLDHPAVIGAPATGAVKAAPKRL